MKLPLPIFSFLFFLTVLEVKSQPEWKQMATGYFHVVGIKNDHTLWTWGENSGGMLGDGTTVKQLTPVQIAKAFKWIQVAAGHNYTVAIREDSTLWTWGDTALIHGPNFGSEYVARQPFQLGTDHNWSLISANNMHIMALKNDGSMFAWGNVQALGNDTYIKSKTPVRIGTENDWKIVAAGGYGFSLAIKQDGTLWAWGKGDDTTWDGISKDITPQQVGTDTNWSKIYGGEVHALALKQDGTLWAWGQSPLPMGTGKTSNSPIPIQIGNDHWSLISTSAYTSLGIKKDGTLWAWGNNSGRFGNGNKIASNVPLQISNETWISVYSGIGYTLAQKAYDKSYCATGMNYYGVFGNGMNTDTTSFICNINETTIAGTSNLTFSPANLFYPNPAHDMIHFSDTDLAHIQLEGIDGRILLRRNFSSVPLDISFLATGIYTIKLTNKQGAVYCFKLIKE